MELTYHGVCLALGFENQALNFHKHHYSHSWRELCCGMVNGEVSYKWCKD